MPADTSWRFSGIVARYLSDGSNDVVAYEVNRANTEVVLRPVPEGEATHTGRVQWGSEPGRITYHPPVEPARGGRARVHEPNPYVSLVRPCTVLPCASWAGVGEAAERVPADGATETVVSSAARAWR